MKKLITVTALTLLMAITTSAQQRNGGMKKGPDFTAEQIATIQTKKMALALDLDETQQKAIYKTFQTAATNRKPAMENFKQKRAAGTKPTSEERFEMEKTKLDKQLAHKAEMKKILNKDQYAKWENALQKRQKKGDQKNMKKQQKNGQTCCAGNNQGQRKKGPQQNRKL